MRIKTTKSEHAEQLGPPTLDIVLANGAYMRRFVQFETSCHTLYGHFLRERYGAGFVGAYRDTPLSLGRKPDGGAPGRSIVSPGRYVLTVP